MKEGRDGRRAKTSQERDTERNTEQTRSLLGEVAILKEAVAGGEIIAYFGASEPRVEPGPYPYQRTRYGQPRPHRRRSRLIREDAAWHGNRRCRLKGTRRGRGRGKGVRSLTMHIHCQTLH